MKKLQRLFSPATWSITTKLSLAMFLAMLIPVGLTTYYNVCQNNRGVLVTGAIATLGTLLLARIILQPIRILTRAAQAWEQDIFSPHRLAKTSRNQNDMGQLFRVFLKLVEIAKIAQEQKQQKPAANVLLQELTTADIDWLNAVGHRREIEAGTVLIEDEKASDALSIVLEGSLRVSVTQGKSLERGVATLARGEIVGEFLVLGTDSKAMTVRALEPSYLLSIPQQQLTLKLQQDAGFASRFYRAIAIILSTRLHNFISHLNRSQLLQDQSLRDVLFVLGELHDSDIDWLIATGSQQKVAANTVIVQEGGAVDALYILLSGTLAVYRFEEVGNPLVRAFAVEGKDDDSSLEIARLSRGEILGETPFIGAHLPAFTVKAVEDSQVLFVPRRRLAAKLQHDVGFSARFYRTIAMLLTRRLQGLLGQVDCDRVVDNRRHSLNGAIKDEDELDFQVLDQMALAGTRFDWILGRLREA
jgi:bacteriocin-type transport-associated protein